MAVYVPITDEIRRKLESERERTGVGPTALMRGTAHDPDRPKTLKGQTISLWLSGKIESARLSQLDYVLARWTSLPTSTSKAARAPQERVKLTPDQLQTIDAFWDAGFLPDKVLNYENVPEGLNAAIIRTWKDRRIKTAAKTYLDFVIAQCAKASSD